MGLKWGETKIDMMMTVNLLVVIALPTPPQAGSTATAIMSCDTSSACSLQTVELV